MNLSTQHEHEGHGSHEHSHGVGHLHAPKDFNTAFGVDVFLNVGLVVAQPTRWLPKITRQDRFELFTGAVKACLDGFGRAVQD